MAALIQFRVESVLECVHNFIDAGVLSRDPNVWQREYRVTGRRTKPRQYVFYSSMPRQLMCGLADCLKVCSTAQQESDQSHATRYH
jgi:predicted NAD/FAD-dependent oxidoreductase